MTKSDNLLRKRLVFVGDSRCGKTSIISRLHADYVPWPLLPPIYEQHVHRICIDEQHVDLAICDTGGQVDCDRLRPLSYPGTDVFVLCFSIDQPSSLESIHEKWVPEVLRFCSPKAKAIPPFVVVGCKKDVRADRGALWRLEKIGEKVVEEENGRRVTERVGGITYLECSAKTGEGVEDVFEAATRVALDRLKKGRKVAECLIV